MKRGMSLIEVLIGAALFFMLISIVGEFFVKEYKLYNKEYVLHKEKIAAYDVIAFVENIIENNIVSIKDDKIIVECKENVCEEILYKEIVYSKNNIKVLTYKTKDKIVNGENTITPYGIKDFQAEIFGNYLIILYIKTWEGYEYCKCIPIRNY